MLRAFPANAVRMSMTYIAQLCRGSVLFPGLLSRLRSGTEIFQLASTKRLAFITLRLHAYIHGFDLITCVLLTGLKFTTRKMSSHFGKLFVAVAL